MTTQPDPPEMQGDVTSLLSAASGGNLDALNDLFPLVYEQLRLLARNRLRAERSDHTLNTTALVHEAYLRLVEQTRVQWQNRAHFYAVASQAMRRVLLNYARERKAKKRGGGAGLVALNEAEFALTEEQSDELIALDDALDRLKLFNPRGAEIVVYRFFGGLTHDEIAAVLNLSEATVRRGWRSARSWLRKELREALPGWTGSRFSTTGEESV